MGGMLFSRANVRTPSDCPLELEAGNNGTAIVVVGRRRRASDPGESFVSFFTWGEFRSERLR